MDQRYVADDTHISSILESHNISADIIANIISMINNIRDNVRYQYVNLDYLTVSCYSLICNNMMINIDHISSVEKTMIRSSDHNNSCNALVRYARYMLYSYQYPYGS